MLSLPATKGFEIGEGFRATQLTGSQHNLILLLSKIKLCKQKRILLVVL